MVVLSCDHAGLRPEFQRLEDEMREALGRIDGAREVREYLKYMLSSSRFWMAASMPHGAVK